MASTSAATAACGYVPLIDDIVVRLLTPLGSHSFLCYFIIERRHHSCDNNPRSVIPMSAVFNAAAPCSRALRFTESTDPSSFRALESVDTPSRITDAGLFSAQTIDESSGQPADADGPVLMIVLMSVALVCVFIVAGFFILKKSRQSARPSDSPSLSAPQRLFFIKAEPDQPSLPSLADGNAPNTALIPDETIVPAGSEPKDSYERDTGDACQDSFVRFNDSPRKVRARGSSSSFWGSFMNSNSIASLSPEGSCQVFEYNLQSPNAGFEVQVLTPASPAVEPPATHTRSVSVTTFVNRLLTFKLKRAVQTDITQSEGFFV